MKNKPFSKASEDYDDYWAEAFSKQLDKNAVQPRRQESIYDQISSVVGGKPRYSSVDAAVKEMQERSGLVDYKKKIEAAKERLTNKTAEDTNEAFDKKIPVESVSQIKPEDIGVFKKHNKIKLKDIIQNIIDSYSDIEVPQIKDRLISMFKGEIDSDDFNDPKFLTYIDNLIVIRNNGEAKVDDTHMLGKRDTFKTDEFDGQDPFKTLEPTAIK